ncbi:MAG: sensor histidine kinase [Bacteroidales bacterium]|nr:sensor histidine kinase [Bacteroidales bacterium]
MDSNFHNKLSIRFSSIVTLAAVLLLIIITNFEFKVIYIVIIAVFYVMVFSFFKIFGKQIDDYNNREFKKKFRKLEKMQKHENIEEWTKKKTQEIAQLKANEQFRKEFIGNVAHELKTPIFNIQGYTSTLLDGAINDPEVNIKYLERTDKNAQRLVAIVKDLDMISKLETGAIVPDIQHFNLTEVVREVLDILEEKSKEYGVNLVFEFNKDLYVYADNEKITEVIHNLALNSIIYGRKDGKTEIIIKEKKKKVFVSVSDNGIGIDEKNLNHIFERFFRVDKSRSRERGGSGLGLAIVKHIIDSHNQTITVESEVGKGTNFTFSLPKIIEDYESD